MGLPLRAIILFEFKIASHFPGFTFPGTWKHIWRFFYLMENWERFIDVYYAQLNYFRDFFIVEKR